MRLSLASIRTRARCSGRRVVVCSGPARPPAADGAPRPVRRLSCRPPEPLTPDHDIDGFVWDSPEQTEWLVRHARQSVANGTIRVFVVTPSDRKEVAAYYAWTMAQLDVAAAPARLRKARAATHNPSR